MAVAVGAAVGGGDVDVRVAVGGIGVIEASGSVALGGTKVEVGGGLVDVRVGVNVGGPGVGVRVIVGVRDGGGVGVAVLATRTPTRPA